MISVLTALVLSGTASGDCGVKTLRIADDHPWLDGDVRAVIRAEDAPPTVARWLVDLGDTGCGPDGTCTPPLEAAWQPGRTTAFFDARLRAAPGTSEQPLTVLAVFADGRQTETPVTARFHGPANMHAVDVEGAGLVLTHPVFLRQGDGVRVVVRAIGAEAALVRSLSLQGLSDAAVPLNRRQLHHVAEGEAPGAPGAARGSGEATIVGLDVAGAEACFQPIVAELDLGWRGTQLPSPTTSGPIIPIASPGRLPDAQRGSRPSWQR